MLRRLYAADVSVRSAFFVLLVHAAHLRWETLRKYARVSEKKRNMIVFNARTRYNTDSERHTGGLT